MDIKNLRLKRLVMEEKLIKNVEHSAPLVLKDLVDYENGKVASMTLSQRPGVGITVMAFDKGESIASHAAPGDAMVQILDGKAEITVGGVPHILEEGQIIVMPKNVSHSLKALEKFKMILTVVK